MANSAGSWAPWLLGAMAFCACEAAGGAEDGQGGSTGDGGSLSGSSGSGGNAGTAGTAGLGGAGGLAGNGGIGGVGGSGGFLNTAPPLGLPLPASTAGQWVWHEIEGSECRDKSRAGFWVKRSSTSKNLFVYLDGGGVCFNADFCKANAANVKERVVGEFLTAGADDPMRVNLLRLDEPVQPYTTGIFDGSEEANPVRDWNAVFIPYCTGDVHAGTRRNVVVPGDSSGALQQFVGYYNMQLFVARIVPTFPDATKVLLTGSSAGGFGAGLNFNQLQDAYAKILSPADVVPVLDSAVILEDKYLDPCLQRQWRELWGLGGALPPDCLECQQADGGGLWQLIPFSARKYPLARLGVISGTQDSIMTFFMSQGENHCTPPFPVQMPADKYEAGVLSLRLALEASGVQAGRFGSYYVKGGTIGNGYALEQVHQWLWLDRFYRKLEGDASPAEWLASVLDASAKSFGP